MKVRVEWDPVKAYSNRRKHGVSFDEAASVFYDPLSITISDPDHSEEEDRFAIVGLSIYRRLLVVVHTDQGDVIRVISARAANAWERRNYEEGTMKKEHDEQEVDMRDHYEFKGGVRGKYVERFAEGANIVVLSPDVAEVFPDSESVNEALRMLMQIAQRSTQKVAS